MSDLPSALTRALGRWLDDHHEASLDAACSWVKAHPVDVGALLAWVDAYSAEHRVSDLARRRLRFALGLPVIPGPVCRR